MFFRGVLLPTAGKLMPGILAFVGQAALFGSWHFVAYGGDTNAMLAAGLFGILAATLNYVFKSLAPSLALHIVYNWGVTS
jgi:membrane protease YdiL (CAAX protease family)